MLSIKFCDKENDLASQSLQNVKTFLSIGEITYSYLHTLRATFQT